ncbi:chaplin family protein [Streptomyces showdoensis]|uniref:chaplin family protein n=1 Tax=Streptomyces showdoensis TaxID=68268 RepID=UPI003CD09919
MASADVGAQGVSSYAPGVASYAPGVSSYAPGVGSGKLLQVPIHVPVNACGNRASSACWTRPSATPVSTPDRLP